MRIRTGLPGGIILLIILIIIGVNTQSETVGMLIILNGIFLIIGYIKNKRYEESINNAISNSGNKEESDLAEHYYNQMNAIIETSDKINAIVESLTKYILKKSDSIPSVCLDNKDEYHFHSMVVKTFAYDVALFSTKRINKSDKIYFVKLMISALSNHTDYNRVSSEVESYYDALKDHLSSDKLPVKVGEVFSSKVIGVTEPQLIMIGTNQFMETFKAVHQSLNMI